MPEFIFMLTKDDRTVADAPSVYREVRAAPLRYIGFKDIGQPAPVLRDLAAAIREDGRVAVLEVVSVDRESELRSIEAGLSLGVGILMGGTHPEDVLPLLRGSEIAYYPFPGTVVGHPSRLVGSRGAIARSAATLSARPGVAGLDLLAYRRRGDAPRLIDEVVRVSLGRVVVAGSIDSFERVAAVGQSRRLGSSRSAGRSSSVGSSLVDRSAPRSWPSWTGPVQTSTTGDGPHAGIDIGTARSNLLSDLIKVDADAPTSTVPRGSAV